MKQDINHINTILLIDDDEDDCWFLGQALAVASANITLICTQTTDNLLEAVGHNMPIIIFIDFHMPKRSGLDCLRQIKSHPEYKHIPVVMWSTSFVSKNSIAETQDVQYFFEKPCCYKELVEDLRVILLQNGIELN